jgi:hypothetical protein
MSMICRYPAGMKIIFMRTEVPRSQFHHASTVSKYNLSAEESNINQSVQKSMKQRSVEQIGAKRF